DGSVQLDIKQEVNDVLGEIIIDGNPQPRIGRRSTESFISVKSGEIIVLGGLQRTSHSRTTNRLGPIPIIGDLLGSRSRDDQRTDLVFFLRPYILTNTAVDNARAIQQMQTLPEAEKERVRESLGVTIPTQKGSKK
ncbi:MAG TPA: type II secretory pathway, component PulD, partial [Candidatus Didemnitutus sp.]|nr:type II secretory pathway, component PulD [Candidatus Didemnitutus sp.]